MQGRILVIDDEKNITLVIQAMLEKQGFEVIAANDSGRALDVIEDEEVDAIVTDLCMPGPGGMEILEHCRRFQPETPVVMVTAFATIESAVHALKRGAFDFITKPFDQDELLATVRKAVLTRRQREKEPLVLANGGEQPSTMIGSSPEMLDVFKTIAKIAGSPSTVLISGESGTGKELVAFEIHRNSPRIKKPFIRINCAAIPAPLIESELFGHEKGAFTGAVSAKPGRFELAHEGTLFLDEVGEMPLEMQVKLLRALQAHEFERVGGVNTVRVDVRIIAATNKDLEAEVKAGRFREDLYYRLNVVPIRIPPLRERAGDIESLVRYFLHQFNLRLGKHVSGLTPTCFDALKAYAWPGNIRQLENVLERMVLMCEGHVLSEEDLPDELVATLPTRGAGAEHASVDRTFKQIVRRKTQAVERELIEAALEETRGNVTRAAERLGLSRKGLQLKLKELGLKRPFDEAPRTLN